MAQPPIAEAMETALRHHQTGRLADAEALYRQILERDPDCAQALHLLGVIAGQTGRPDAAAALIRRAIELDPDLPEAYCNLAFALRRAGQFDAAVTVYKQAIARRGDYFEARHQLGNTLFEQGRCEEAADTLRQALALRPDSGALHNDLGNALKAAGRLQEALTEHRRAVELEPASGNAHYNYGDTLYKLDQVDQAIDALSRAVALKSDLAEAHNNLAVALQQARRFDEAAASYQRAMALKPDDVATHWNYATLLLLLGQFPQAWGEYEWRRRRTDAHAPSGSAPGPLWNGDDLAGRTIFLYAEQGIGDTIHFARYAALVARRGGRVVLECQGELTRLLGSCPGVAQCVARGQPPPPYDVQCPLLSLPSLFGTTLQSIPATVPYVHTPAELAEQWRHRTPGDDGRLKVGLAWAGNPANPNDPARSLPLSALAPLAQVAGVRFYSLQKGPAAAQARQPPPGMSLLDLSDELADFADTAALIAGLDLVISADTAVAHLAGAMSKPVWTLLPFAPDWRWMLDRDDSPWYPTMRLLRQSEPGQWAAVIARAAHDLQSRC